MILLRDIGLARFVKASIFFNPNISPVRFAKRKVKQSKMYYEFTNMANWRRERGLTVNPNKYGPLTNLPDYSYLDGRPVPLGLNLRKRLEKQKEYSEAIVQLSAEVDFARERSKRLQAEKEEHKQFVLNNKLMKKGSTFDNE